MQTNQNNFNQRSTLRSCADSVRNPSQINGRTYEADLYGCWHRGESDPTGSVFNNDVVSEQRNPGRFPPQRVRSSDFFFCSCYNRLLFYFTAFSRNPALITLFYSSSVSSPACLDYGSGRFISLDVAYRKSGPGRGSEKEKKNWKENESKAKKRRGGKREKGKD